jgi:hypothetical protein
VASRATVRAKRLHSPQATGRNGPQFAASSGVQRANPESARTLWSQGGALTAPTRVEVLQHVRRCTARSPREGRVGPRTRRVEPFLDGRVHLLRIRRRLKSVGFSSAIGSSTAHHTGWPYSARIVPEVEGQCAPFRTREVEVLCRALEDGFIPRRGAREERSAFGDSRSKDPRLRGSFSRATFARSSGACTPACDLGLSAEPGLCGENSNG